MVLSSASPVRDAIRLVAHNGLVFLAGSSGISDFIVASDLDRHVVRSYLYVVLAEIELRLADLTRNHVPESEIIAQFKVGQRARYKAACEQGKESNPVEYLYLSNYRLLLTSLAPLLATSMWVAERTSVRLEGSERTEDVCCTPVEVPNGNARAR